MQKKRLTAISVIIGVCACLFGLAASCAGKGSSQAETSAAARANAPVLGAVNATYIIGDASIIETGTPVNGDGDRYGYYTVDAGSKTYRYSRHDIGWAAAMSAESSASGRVCVRLASDWVALPTDRIVIGKKSLTWEVDIALTTTFGDDASVFPYGRIEVPENTYVRLDLNGCVIDRNLSSKVDHYGQVIYGYNCSLEVVDGNPTKEHKDGDEAIYTYADADGESVEVTGGVITGGNNYYEMYSGDDLTQYVIEHLGGGISVKIDKPTENGGIILTAATLYKNVYYIGGDLYRVCDIYGSDACLEASCAGALYICDGVTIVNKERSSVTTRGEIELIMTGGIVEGGIIAYGGAFNMSGGEITDCAGSGVYINGGAFNMSGGEITDCAGSGVYINGGAFNMSGGVISDNVSTNSGGGVYIDNALMTMTGGIISDNVATEDGGGIFSFESTLIIDGGEILRNTANINEYGGGGFYCTDGYLTINGGKISNNTVNVLNTNFVVGCGGGGAVRGSVFVMNGGEISDNEVIADNGVAANEFIGGGGIYFETTDFMTKDYTYFIHGGEIKNNAVHKENGDPIGFGGGICGCLGSMLIDGGKISGNTAYRGGGFGGVFGGGFFDRFVIAGGEITDNIANDGVAYVENNYTERILLYGSPIIGGNADFDDNECNFCYNVLSVAGKLDDGAHIGIGANVEIRDFAKYNNDTGETSGYNYGSDPSKYFYADDGSSNVLLTADGNVVVDGSAFELYADYSDGADTASTVAPDVYGVTFEYAKGCVGAFTLKYDGAEVAPTQSGSSDITNISGAGNYEFTYDVGDKTYKFVFVVAPRDLSDADVSIDIDGSSYAELYDGQAKEPRVSSVVYGGDTFTDGIDYEITYERNTNVGTGYVVVSFTGNYCGEKRVPFDITTGGGLYYSVEWQFYNGTAWQDADGDISFGFIPDRFNGDHANRVRAKLTLSGDGAGDEIKYAYADRVVKGEMSRLDGTVANADYSGYRVAFSDGAAISALTGAGVYGIKLVGTDNYAIGDGGKTVNIAPLELTENDSKLAVSLDCAELVYDGSAKTPDISVMYNNSVTLVKGEDYDVIYSDGVNAASATLGGRAACTVTFKGNYSGSVEMPFDIAQAENEWKDMPSIVWWTYGGFDADRMVVKAAPRLLLDGAKVHVSILDKSGGVITANGVTLSDIAVKPVVNAAYGDCYAIDSRDAADILDTLDVGQYTLAVWVDETSSYAGLSPVTVLFSILKADNYWDEAPSIARWSAGEFDASVNLPAAKAHFGEAVSIVITDAATGETVFYSSQDGIDMLKDLPVGSYYMTATVAGTDNWSELVSSQLFRVFEAEVYETIINKGMPWWGVLLIVVGALGLAALVIFILHKKGVFSILSEKMVVAIRAKADIDATIAAVRAGHVTAAAKQSVAEAEARDAADAEAQAKQEAKEQAKLARKAAALEQAAKSPEEKAAALVARANALKERAADLKARAKTAEERAVAMTLTPEEKAAQKEAEREAEKRRQKAKTPEGRAEALEAKARDAERQADILRTRAEVMKSRASVMRERAAQQAERAAELEKQDEQAQAPHKTAHKKSAKAVREAEASTNAEAENAEADRDVHTSDEQL